MVSSPRPPSPPDPRETAAAQSTMNRETAITQYGLNATNQVTPDGTLSYEQVGTWADGTPRFQATTALSPEQQAIKTQGDAASLNLGTIANQQSGFLKDYLAKPFEYNNEDAEAWINDLGSKRLDPRFAREEDALRTRLINSGIREGSAAFDAAFSNFSQSKNDAYNNLALTGRQQAYGEALTDRNQPLNEINALMSGSQVSNPAFQSTPQPGVAGVDYTGMVDRNYQGQLANWQQRVQSQQGMLGGLFGLASAGVTAFSDRRLKTDIRRVGVLDNGLGVYSYRFKSGGPVQIGVMADEVAAVRPEAVVRHESGFDMVDYGMATEAA